MKHFKHLLLLALLITFNIILAQPQKKLWSLPGNYIKFNTGPGTVTALPIPNYNGTDYYGLSTSNAHNALHDANGNLLFFIVDDPSYGVYNVYDKNGILIGSLTYGGNPISGGSEIAIVPVPNDCNKYYLIVSINECAYIAQTCYGRFGYATIDVSLTGSNGSFGSLLNNGVVTLLKQFYNNPPKGLLSQFAVTQLRPATNDRLLFATLGGYIYKFTISSTGFTELASSGDVLNTTNSTDPNKKSELEVVTLSNGNYRLAYSTLTEVGIADFYSTGILVAGSMKKKAFSSYSYVHGIEFSLDASNSSLNGKYLYVAHEQSPYLEYIDATAGTLTSQTISVSNASLFGNGQIGMGNDYKFYFASTSQLGSLSLNTNGTPNTGTWNSAAVTGLNMGAPYLNDQIDGEVYYPPTPTITGNNFACSAGTEIYTLQAPNYSSTVTYTWTVTGGTPTTFKTTGTTSSQPITWGINGGTITVKALGAGGCSTPVTFIVKPCCRYVEAGKTTVYLNDRVENSPATFTAIGNPIVGGTGPFIYVVNGSYTINSNAVTFSGAQTYFDKDVQVTVNSPGYLKLQAGTVWQAGCNGMWKGIIVNTGGNLWVDNSTIQDALLAIKSKDGAPFTVQNNSVLNKNYRGIYYDAYAGGTPHPGTIKQSKITCLDNSGNPVNLPLSPYAGVRAYSGIETSNVTQVNIGDASAANLINTFDNLEFGIINANTNLTVYNNNFNRINIQYYPQNYQRGRCISSTNNNTAPSFEKKLTVGGSGTYQKNTFTDSYLGVYAATNQDVNIFSNTFINLAHTAAYIYYCNTIGTSGNDVFIVDNKIDDCATGIYSLGSGGSHIFYVSGNNINLNTPTGNSKPNSKAITVTNAALSTGATAPTFSIISNTIKRVSTGIEVTNFTAPSIRSNTITALSDLGWTGPEIHGIYATYNPSLDLEWNTVTGTSGSTWWQKAIYVGDCANSLITNNSMQDIGAGFYFGGLCDYTETGKNHMKNNYNGMEFNYGRIGYQYGSPGSCISPGNSWEGTFNNSHIASLWSDGNQSTMNLYGSACNPVSGPCTNPSPFVSVLVTSGFGYNAVPTPPCGTLSTRSAGDGKHDQMVRIAKDRLNSLVNSASSKWMAKYALYNMLKSDPALQNGDFDLKSFSDSAATTNLGKLHKVNTMLGNGDPNLASAEGILKGLSAGNMVEQNLIDVFTITAANRKDDNLSASQIKKLQIIAVQCPYEGGPGVYNARVLLSTIDNTVYVNNCEIVKPAKYIIKRSSDDNIFNNTTISVFPNPTNDKVNVAIHIPTDQKGSISLFDLSGKLQLSYILYGSSDITEISTASLTPSLYIYKINVNGAVVSTGKLSIIR